MKLHRLSVTNYRGIAHRDIEFPERGVVVVSGANEVGKTSMIEALDLLIESKDRSAKKDVKQVKPTHADVGSEVEAEISCGPYRFVYRKRFHKRPETHLTVIAPRREQLSGDEAHQRVLEMLSASMDMNLWKAQRVLQSTGAGTVDLSASDALTRALDLAAGQSVALSGSEPDLVERIDSEYALYFTSTGRPTGEWARAAARRTVAEDAMAAAAAAVAEVEEQVRRHDELTRALSAAIDERGAAVRRLAPLEEAAQAVSALAAQRENARLVADAARSASESAREKVAERERLGAEVAARAAAVGELSAAVTAAQDARRVAEQVAQEASEAAESAGTSLAALRLAHDAAREALDRAQARDEVDALAARLTRIDVTTRQLDSVRADLTVARMDATALAALDAAAHSLSMAEVALQAATARVEITALSDLQIVVDGESVTVAAGEQWSAAAVEDVDITAPGVLSARIVPGANASELRAAVESARARLQELLAASGVEDVSQARLAYERRLGLVAERDRLTALLDGLLGTDDVNVLREKLARLRELAPHAAELWDALGPEQARSEVTRLAAEIATAQRVEETHRRAADTAKTLFAQRVTESTVAAGNLALHADELAAIRSRLSAARAATADAVLHDQCSAAAEAATLTARRVEDLAAQLAGMQSDRVRAELAEAAADCDRLTRRHDALRDELRDIAVRLEIFGRQGRKDQFDAAASEHEYAAAEFMRVGARARAVDTLRSVMMRHRDDMRLRYVDPFRAELERLGRVVFGPTFEVDVDSDLSIRSRTLDGRTVPFESLSGGAQEQLGIVARLASAALVAPEDAVPVIIDDALGFSDGERLLRMGEVFGAVGTDAQVIVLTCSPERYRAVADAHRISLSA